METLRVLGKRPPAKQVVFYSVEGFITIEPAILFHLEKPDNAVIRFIFDEYMTLEET